MPRLEHVSLVRVGLTKDHVDSLGRLTGLGYLDLKPVYPIAPCIFRTITMTFPQFRFVQIDRERFTWSVGGPCPYYAAWVLDKEGLSDAADTYSDAGTGTGTDLNYLRIDVLTTPDDRTLIIDMLGRCPGLRHFYWRPYTDIAVLAALGQLSALTHLELEMRIDPDVMPVFARALGGVARTLKHLVCSEIAERSLLTDALARALSDLTQLRSLDAVLLTPSLARAVGRLTLLEWLKVGVSRHSLEEFIRSLDTLPALRHLEMWTKGTGPSLSASLGVTVGKLVNLQFLEMGSVHFTAYAQVGLLKDLRCLLMRDDAEASFVGGTLAGALGGLTRLTRLLLPSYIQVDTEASAALAEGLAPLVNLQALHLRLRNADAVATIARRCLAGLTALTHLDVGYNRMGRQEVLAIIELAAPHLKDLRTFDVHGNGLTEDDLTAVTSAFGRDGIDVRSR
jgi:hypothetical protein